MYNPKSVSQTNLAGKHVFIGISHRKGEKLERQYNKASILPLIEKKA